MILETYRVCFWNGISDENQMLVALAKLLRIQTEYWCRVKLSNKRAVLLRECKRHTTRHIESTLSAVLSWGWGYPIPGQEVPHTGVPPPRKGPGTSHWGTPLKGHGTSGSIMGWKWGTPSPPFVNRHLWKQYLPVALRTRKSKSANWIRFYAFSRDGSGSKSLKYCATLWRTRS